MDEGGGDADGVVLPDGEWLGQPWWDAVLADLPGAGDVDVLDVEQRVRVGRPGVADAVVEVGGESAPEPFGHAGGYPAPGAPG